MKNKRTPDQIFTELEHIAHMIPAPLYWLDIKGMVLGVNDALYKLVGGWREIIIGKEHHHFYPKEVAEKLTENNNRVIQLSQTVEFEERIADMTTGVMKNIISIRSPLCDDDHKVIGIIGTSIDVTAERKAQRQKEEAQQKFKKTVDQMIHDIGTPMAALDILIANCAEIPEETRINIREALSRIHGITGNVLSQYKAEKSGIPYGNQYEAAEPVMLSAVLMQLISERRQQHPKIKFILDFPKISTFTFIRSQPLEFQRMISNIINNSVDAFENNNGSITLHLKVDDKLVKIIIEDNGKGMSEDIIGKILNNIEVTQGKAHGHGIGMGQVRDTLNNNNGKFEIDSQIGVGTKVTLTFPKIIAPNWVADKIELYNNDLVVVLDDDSSIHGAWDQRFKMEVPHIKLKHYTVGEDAVKFINSLSAEVKQNIFLLTDFELLKQDLNGLDVIRQTGLERSILVTSHYASLEIQNLANKIGTKILPKRVASEVPVLVKEHPVATNVNQLKLVDLVILDDDEFFGELLVSQLSRSKVVDYYSNADELLNNVACYHKSTKFSLDNQLKNTTGLEIAKRLHNLGYTNLYMLSGEFFTADQVPDYLTVIMKTDSDAFARLKDL